MSRHYRLDEDHNPVPISEEWVMASIESGGMVKRVASDEIGDVTVSTVFLGLDHNWSDEGPPILFETMIFGGRFDEDQYRYATWDEAVREHQRIVEWVKEDQK